LQTLYRLALSLATVFTFSACAQTPAARNASQAPAADVAIMNPPAPSARRQHHLRGSVLGNGKIQHVVIIFQENRSTDSLFNGLSGADTVSYGYNTAGDKVKLQSISLTAPWDIAHSHVAFNTAFDGGRMDGFNLEQSSCSLRHTRCTISADVRAYTFVRRSEIKPYFTMAQQYAFGDKMFASQAGPSFPAHQYIVSGAATVSQSSTLRAAENGLDPTQKFTAGCDSPPGSLVTLIDANGTEDQQVYPCFDRPSLTDLIENQQLTWRYYQYQVGPGLWNALDAIKHVRYSSQYSADVISPPSQVLSDIANGNLANVVWVTPTAKASDHPVATNGTGPSWVASVVNAIGKSSYWNSTAIFVTWDDWGGFYDHVTPPQYNSYELGFRVPLIAISPYAKQGYVSHVQHEFGSLLKFTEEAFNLGSLGATDQRADDLSDMFSFSRKPRKFVPIRAPLGPGYFLRQPPSSEIPDND
jgi:phospholipase C